jgi:hypothetical protein
MSDKLMDTEPGGEQTQYEGVHTFIEPHAKQGGQLAGMSLPLLFSISHLNPHISTLLTHARTGNSDRTSVHKQTGNDPGAPNTQGVSTADKIRYGQSIQEGGAGGKTTTSTGQANEGSGFGGAEALNEEQDSAAKTRREQGYGGDKDMDRNIGA